MAWIARFRHCLVLLLLLGTILPAAAQQPADRRIALVIGIGAYQNAPKLANPVNDARAIGESLRRLNFDVDEVFDPDFRGLTLAIRAFGIKAQSAGVAVIYYAGHGVQVGRENYLLPADTRLERERDLLYEAVPLELVLGEVSQSGRLGIVLLDACRNNPFVERMTRSMTLAGRGVSSAGLARVDNVPRNTVVAMSTKADQVAEDGTGDHSPFAEALQANFAMPGLELSLFFRSVRDSVLRATNGRQEPYVFSSLGADPFYFNPRPPNRPPVLGAMPPMEVRDTAGPTPIGIGMPTDPDQDPLTVRITGLPRYGEVQIDGRAVRPGAVFPADRIVGATYKPEMGRFGPVGTFDILIEDGRGGNAMGSIPIAVASSNRPPVVEQPRRISIYTGPLGIVQPEDPDGDKLTVLVTSLPRGLVRNGTTTLRIGDRLQPDVLASLVFVPEPGFVGPAGSVGYRVEDGRGGLAESSLDIDVIDAAEAAAEMAMSALWERLRRTGKIEDLDAFTRFYPNSRFAAAIAKRRAELSGEPSPLVAAAPPAPRPAPVSQPALPPPPRPAPPERLAFAQPPAAPPAATVIEPPPPPPQPDRSGARDCATCPVLIRIPGGGFSMGQNAKDPAALPVHHVSIRSFWLAEAPVTVGEWKACAADGGCAPPPRMTNPTDATAIHNVSWDDAQRYVAWLSRTSGRAYRLPTEAEWEFAARAGTTTRFWWGDQAGTVPANCTDCGPGQDPRTPEPARSFRPNPLGLYGMGGGVAQWVQDCWFPNYAGAPGDGSAREANGCAQRVLRGGSFRSPREDIQTASRSRYDAPVRYLTNGFRVARSAE